MQEERTILMSKECQEVALINIDHPMNNMNKLYNNSSLEFKNIYCFCMFETAYPLVYIMFTSFEIERVI